MEQLRPSFLDLLHSVLVSIVDTENDVFGVHYPVEKGLITAEWDASVVYECTSVCHT